MIQAKTKYCTDINVGDAMVKVCNRSKGSFLFPGSPQLQILDEDNYIDAYVNLSDQEIDEIIEALQKAKIMVD